MKWMLGGVGLFLLLFFAVIMVLSRPDGVGAPSGVRDDATEEGEVVDARSPNYQVVDVKTTLDPGELAAAQQILLSKSWQLVSLAGEGGAVALVQPEAFVLTLKPDGTFSATTDCNNQFGTYRASETEFLVGDIGSTMMYCEGSQERLFSGALAAVTAYEIGSKGELRLFTATSTAEMIFQ